jgi:transglutaminase-like putative cysteine protease
MALTMTAAAPARAADALDGTGAARAWTSTDPKLAEARELYLKGDYSKAESVARAASDRVAAGELVDILRYARQDYTLDDAGLIEKLKPLIPDVTPADVDRWCAADEVIHKTIDGKRMFFSREPNNLFKLSASARQRRDAHNPAAAVAADPEAVANWKLTDHLAKVVEEANRTGQEFVCPVHHKMKYTVTVTPGDAGGKAGSTLRVWLPFPQEYRQQRNVKLISTTPAGGQVAPNAVDASPMGGAAQRTVYFETKVSDPTEALKYVVEFEYDSYAYYPKLDEAKAQSLPSDFGMSYLAERPPHIVFTPGIRQAVAEAVGTETNPLAKARAIFYWVDKNIKYRYEDEYCTIPSFADRIFKNRRGDCGLQGTLFTTMCRIAGVPARWQSGWGTKVSGRSMHDWAEFYVAPWGWLPVDASYGLQKSDDPAVRDFYIGHQDSYRFIVNLDYGRQLHPPKHSLRSEPADFQRGEVELDGKNLYFDQWKYLIEIERS